MKRINLTLLTVFVVFSYTTTAQIRIKPPFKTNKGNATNVKESKSPASSDIKMADHCVKSLSEMYEKGDFDNNVLRTTSVKDKLEQFESYISKIEEKDKKYDVSEYQSEYKKYKEAYEKGEEAYKESLVDLQKKNEAEKEANKPANKRLREIQEWQEDFVFERDAGAISQSSATKSFNSGDDIVGRVYLNKPFKTLFRQGKIACSFEVAGELIYQDNMTSTPPSGEKHFDVEVVRHKGYRVNRLKAFNKLPEGKHEVKVYVGKYSNVNPGTAYAIGSFELNVTAEGKKKWDEIIYNYERSIWIDNEAPKAGMNNSTISNAAIKFYKEKDFNGEPIKAYIDSEDWAYSKNAYGVIEYRHLDAVVVIQINEEACEYSIIGIKQESTNGGYGANEYNGIGATRKILCSKIK